MNNISVSGFKSIDTRQTVDLRPLTLLAGANSSGKSSMLQPLLLLRQTLEAPFETGPLLLDSDDVQFSSASQLFTVAESPTSATWDVQLSSESFGSIQFTFRLTSERPGVELYSVELNGAVARPGMSYEDMSAAGLLGDLVDRFDQPLAWGVTQHRFLLVPYVMLPGGRWASMPGEWDDANALVALLLRSIIHLPGLRGNPAREYARTAVPRTLEGRSDQFPGEFQGYVAGLLQSWAQTNEQRFNSIEQELRLLGLTTRLVVQAIDDVRVELRVGRKPSGQRVPQRDLVNIADVGLGVSQVLPVLVALHAAAPGQVVLLEQPELHLHPRSQRALASLLAEAAERGVTVVAETHSSLILRELQILVAKGELDPGLVGLHWFTRDPKTGMTNVTFGEMDENGAFGDWPEDFDDISLAADSDYLDAVSARRNR